MTAHGHRLLLLLCCLCADWTRGTAHSGLGQLLPPTNITFGMNGIFCLFWTWTPTAKTTNCSLKYKTEILTSPSHTSPGGRDKHPYYTLFLDTRIDLNKNLTLKVYTECDNTTSAPKNFISPLATGNPGTMVRNMSCVWHYKEYVNCTWRPGEIASPSVNYTLHYWLDKEHICLPVENKKPTPFYDLLDDGNLCQNYTYHSGIPVGCQFKLEEDFNHFYCLLAVVTDRTQNSKPYLYFISVNNIAKLKPPVIKKIERTPSNSLLVSWNVSNTPKDSEYQLQVNNEIYLVSSDSKEVPNALPDVTYTAKVRVRLPQHAVDLPDPQNENFLWSEWSEEGTLVAIEGGKTAFTVLLLLVSFVIIVAVVLLLINMRRLRILLCPQIPDPSKGISSDFQQWLKYGKSVYNEPKKEEVCVVSLLETSPSSQVENAKTTSIPVL
ncbi:interleukin-13 receptor subunit alpha-1-like [Dendropsophus ebraccatus]|uniref:interleukin-13 receptor subunit alpha-1-like n=1 Tax=Dendropsophus ebraccatus TaxID=150705 RepID=UPI003831CB09